MNLDIYPTLIMIIMTKVYRQQGWHTHIPTWTQPINVMGGCHNEPRCLNDPIMMMIMIEEYCNLACNPICTNLAIMSNLYFCHTYSRRAFGSFCICWRIICIAGSARICCSSGSCIARRRTESGSLPSWIMQL